MTPTMSLQSTKGGSDILSIQLIRPIDSPENFAYTYASCRGAFSLLTYHYLVHLAVLELLPIPDHLPQKLGP